MYGVKWQNFKLVFVVQRYLTVPALPLNNPHIVNLVTDLKEREPYNPLYFHSWTMAHFGRLLKKFQMSVAASPSSQRACRWITFRTCELNRPRKSPDQINGRLREHFAMVRSREQNLGVSRDVDHNESSQRALPRTLGARGGPFFWEAGRPFKPTAYRSATGPVGLPCMRATFIRLLRSPHPIQLHRQFARHHHFGHSRMLSTFEPLISAL